MSGNIGSKEFQNGYILFVSFTYGSWNPKLIKDRVRLKILCKLTTGETLKDAAYIRITYDAEKFEKWVPGIIDQVGHESSWHAIKK